MTRSMLHCILDDEDGLRLLALSRIPQCTACPRLAALQANHGSGAARPIPDAPAECTYRYCAPLATRYGRLESSLDAPSALATTERENVGLRHALLETEVPR